MTDTWDRRCIITILEGIMNKKTTKEGFKLDKDGNFTVPDCKNNLILFNNALAELNEDHEGPELYGLHNNANISSAKLTTERIMNDALSVQPRATGGVGKSYEETIEDMCTDILKELPEDFDLDYALKSRPISYNNCMNTVLNQELIRFNNLTKFIRSTLGELKKAMKGLAVLSPLLEGIS